MCVCDILTFCLQQLIVDLINNNQLGVGPWYTQPDEFLVSGEALVRNLLYGIITLEGNYLSLVCFVQLPSRRVCVFVR